MQQKPFNPGSRDVDPLDEFGEKLSETLNKGNFVRLVLSHPIQREDGIERVLGRCVNLKGTPHLSVTLRYPTRDEVKNLSLTEGVGWVMSRVRGDFRSALLCTTERDWQLSIGDGQRARLIPHPASTVTAPSRDHDQTRRSLLDNSAADWLAGLRISDRDGKVRPAMTDKYRQISHYIEILSHLATDCGWSDSNGKGRPDRDLVVVDMGSGKGYLTFGAWHLFRRIWSVPARFIGVEARAELVANTNRVASKIGARELEFVSGTIETVQLPPADVLIALHACDTATDQAIERGIKAGAQLILVAPCCHKEVRPKMGRPAPLGPLLQHGLLQERLAEWLTDGLRALFLEWAGYRTRVFEFVASEHTPKNVMIAAIRESTPFADSAVQKQIQDLKSFFGIKTHTLDVLLTTVNAV